MTTWGLFWPAEGLSRGDRATGSRIRANAWETLPRDARQQVEQEPARRSVFPPAKSATFNSDWVFDSKSWARSWDKPSHVLPTLGLFNDWPMALTSQPN